MDLQFYGANCVGITYKGTRLVVDDNLTELGSKSVLKAGDVALYTFEHKAPKVDVRIALEQPGEYEISDISIVGIPTRAHMDEEGKRSATMYKLMVGDFNVLITGHVHPNLPEKLWEQISIVDVMIVPVGGSGYTLDPLGALKLIKEIEPKIVIPTHYADKSLNFPVPQLELVDALRELGMETKETTAKLKLRPTDLSDITQLIVLEKA